MSRFISAAGAVAFLAAGAASAGEPVQLTDIEMDVVTAGLDVGAFIEFGAANPGSPPVLGSSFRISTGPLGPIGASVDDGEGNTASAAIGGNVGVSNQFSLFKTAIGTFDAEVSSTGDGGSFVNAGPVVQNANPGLPTIEETSFIQTGPNSGTFVTFAAGFNGGGMGMMSQ